MWKGRAAELSRSESSSTDLTTWGENATISLAKYVSYRFKAVNEAKLKNGSEQKACCEMQCKV